MLWSVTASITADEYTVRVTKPDGTFITHRFRMLDKSRAQQVEGDDWFDEIGADYSGELADTLDELQSRCFDLASDLAQDEEDRG